MSAPVKVPASMIVNQQEAALILGRSARWLSGKNAPRIPKSDGGGYEIPKLVAWFVSIETASELRDEKTRQEIKVLEKRNRKLDIENQTKGGNLVDVNELFGWADRMGAYIRRAGDLIARKNTLTGREAQEIINTALDDFEKCANEFQETYAGETPASQN